MSTSRTSMAGRFLRIPAAFILAGLILGTGALPAAAASAPYLVKNIKAGAKSSNPFNIVALGDVVVFSASGGAAGREIWRSDGTAAGTYRLLDIRAGGKSSNPRGLTPIGDKVFFSANDGPHGQELWVTDGTTVGTHLVKDVMPGKASLFGSGVDEPVAVDVAGVAFFTAPHDTRLWRSDGTDAGTYAVPDSPSNVANLTAFGNQVYFGAEGRLWRSDGTGGGTVRIKNSLGKLLKQPRQIVATDYFVFFEYRESAVWRTDGTQAGTFELVDAGSDCVYIYNCSLMDLSRAGNLVFFYTHGPPSIRVWRSDGTVSGTFPVVEGSGGGTNTFFPVGDRMYITGDLLRVSDGSVAGTSLVDTPEGMHVIYVFDVAGDAYYTALLDGDPLGRLFSTDGTALGTVQVGPPSPGWPIELTVATDKVIFHARDARGDELWAMNL